MNIKNKTARQLKTEIPILLNQLEKGVLYNLSIRKVKTMSAEPKWFEKFRLDYEKFRDNQLEFNRNQQEFNLKIVDKLESLNIKVDHMDNRLKKIESLPTIQKELNN